MQLFRTPDGLIISYNSVALKNTAIVFGDKRFEVYTKGAEGIAAHYTFSCFTKLMELKSGKFYFW